MVECQAQAVNRCKSRCRQYVAAQEAGAVICVSQLTDRYRSKRGSHQYWHQHGEEHLFKGVVLMKRKMEGWLAIWLDFRPCASVPQIHGRMLRGRLDSGMTGATELRSVKIAHSLVFRNDLRCGRLSASSVSSSSGTSGPGPWSAAKASVKF